MPRKFAESLGYAGRGLVYAFRTQRNLKIHLATGAFAVILGVLLQISFVEMMILVLVISSVVVLELLNTAMEEIVNLMMLTRKIRAMVAKDVAAGAVLVAAIASVVIGCYIFLPRLIVLVFRS
ncbi:MAG: diacylglycerol kinase family protein [Candidatus Margulisiibacteriota bacterium]